MRKPTKWPCIFSSQFFKEQVAARLYEKDPKTPFGAFVKAWRQLHCATINPYGSESAKGSMSVCPYAEEDCALAFLIAANRALLARKSRIGLFRIIAQKKGWERAENKPLARDRIVRTDGQTNRKTDLRDGPGAGPGDDLGGPPPGGLGVARGIPVHGPGGVRGSTHRPQRIGDLLWGNGAGPRTHPYGRHESQEAADHDGDAGDPVSPPSSRRLGNQPPSGDPDLHQGSE